MADWIKAETWVLTPSSVVKVFQMSPRMPELDKAVINWPIKESALACNWTNSSPSKIVLLALRFFNSERMSSTSLASCLVTRADDSKLGISVGAAETTEAVAMRAKRAVLENFI